MTRRIVFATCRALPQLQPGDVSIAEALQARGSEVVPVPWNGPFEPFEDADVVVVRSTWDYAEAASDFVAWLEALATVRGTVVNAPALMVWNSNKNYLLDLQARGASLPPTRLVRRDPGSILAAMAELGLTEAVVKPVVGASASGLSIVRMDDEASVTRAAERLGYDGLLQPLIPEIRTIGETSATFFRGEFSHAVVKRPRQGSMLVQEEHGGSTKAVTMSSEQVRVACSVLELLPEPPVIARVDLVLTETRALLMEVEVIEPELFVLHDPDAPKRCADAILGERSN